MLPTLHRRLDRLARCSDAVRQWFLENYLQLNADKSNVMILGTSAHQLKSAAAVTTVDVADSLLPVTSQIKSLSVIIDSHLRFDRQARQPSIAKVCNYHIHALRHVRKLLTDETARTVACSIAARLDYCNAVLYGALATTLNKLQCVSQGGVSSRRCGRADAQPLLKSLHWLPLNQPITYKVILVQ